MSPLTERQPNSVACSTFFSTGRAPICDSVPNSTSTTFMITPTCLK